MDATSVTVHSITDVGPNTVAIDLETPDGFHAEPGQFVLVRADVNGEELARHYTISSPRVGDTFEITVGVDPDGDLSPWLADLEEGDELSVAGPFGSVSYAGDGPVLTLAGGPGIGPALAIAERAVEDGHDAAVVYFDDAPAHEDRLDDLEAGGTPVRIVDSEDGLSAAVQDLAGTGQPFVFGFREFCDLAVDALEAAGEDAGDVEVESFG